jgi:phosphoglucomutase
MTHPLQVYRESLEIHSFHIVQDSSDVDIDAQIGSQFSVGSNSILTIIDPFDCYIETLKNCFNFDNLRSFCQSKGASTLLFDGMHGAGGPFARRIFVDELGLPEVSADMQWYL